MRRVPLIAVIAGCSATPAPVAPAPPPPAQPTETLWDRGTFVTVDKDVVLPDVEEKFEIYRTGDGYRFVVTWKRPAPTGEPSEGEAVLTTDDHFSPLQGKMTTTLHTTSRAEVTRSTIQREPDGRLSTEVIAWDGSKETGHSTQPNDWFIGGTITTFLVALCQADAAITQPIVYPDKATTLAAFKPLAVEGTQRSVSSRMLVYDQSHRQVIAACENGKLAGEVARGSAVVRSGDLALARVLESFH
ncbi:MAG TPA: hypothetical protein VIV40_33890 [Kofleriaceae bacterium]